MISKKTKSSSSQDDRNWAIASHLSIFLGLVIPFANIILPLFIYLMKKDSSVFVSTNAKRVINFQLSIMIYMLISALLVILLIGIPALVVVFIFGIIQPILGAMAASEGKDFSYSYSIEFIK